MTIRDSSGRRRVKTSVIRNGKLVNTDVWGVDRKEASAALGLGDRDLGSDDVEIIAYGQPVSEIPAELGHVPETALLSPDGQTVNFDGQVTQLVEQPWGTNMLASAVGDKRAFTYTTYSAPNFYVHTELHDRRGVVSVNVMQAERIESLGGEARAAHDTLVAKTVEGDAPEPGNGDVSRPVHFTDDRVQKGLVFDTITAPNGVVMHRRRDGIYPNEPYAMRFQSDLALDDVAMRRAAQLIGYQYASTVRGESMSEPVRDSPYSFVINADTTKGKTDDLGRAMRDFESGLGNTLQYGSPKRTTNNAGAGTKDTRLVKGMGIHPPNFEIYYDDVTSADGY